VQALAAVESLPEELRLEAYARVGTTLLGKWHLDALIGIGGMAAVFAATHRNGLRGAVKVPWAQYSRDEEICGRFLREGYIANRVNHPGAVRVLDDDTTTDGRAFLVMELLDGSPLHELAEAHGGRLDPARVLLVSDQVLDVLCAAHDKGIVHRDIKPENLFLTSDGRVKVLDFGIARTDERGGPALRATQSGAPMGTPGFMAPEQARGRWDLVGPQSDIWSVGATMFTLLSGATVHDGETIAEIVSASFTKPARSIANVMSGLPGPVADLVDRALALEPAARWSDVRAMQAAVRDAYREIFGEALPTVVPQIPVVPIARPSPVTPVTKSILPARARLSPDRRPPRGLLIALGSALAVFALAAVALQGSARGHAARPAVASAPTEDRIAVAPGSVRDEVTHDPPVVPALPDSAPSALPVTLAPKVKAASRVQPISTPAPSAAPAPSHPPQPDLKALFDRRH
jgi:eukaryotic-like serine/threonine-protein kinase